MQGVGHLLGDLIHFGVGDVHAPPHVPDDAPGRHGAKRHDLGHVVVAVLPSDIVHHLAPADIAEVHIDIGHAHPLRVQEALEVQAVLHGVDVRDMETVRNHGTGGGAAARAHGDAHALGVAHEIRHDEEVVREAHLLDHVLFVL